MTTISPVGGQQMESMTPPVLTVDDYVAALRREGDLLAAAAESSDLGAVIPNCPGWSLADMVRHVGGVHRWATAHVAQQRRQPMGQEKERALMASWPSDDSLIAWFRDGHAALVHTLTSAEPDLQCWTFLDAPTPLAFWARRQAHETAIHRSDAESAAGKVTEFSPAFAADGIDELLYCFASRPGGRLRAEPPRTLRADAADAGRAWLITISTSGLQVREATGESADCTVEGSASDLYLLLWNRRTIDGLAVAGEASLFDQWRQSVQIRWG